MSLGRIDFIKKTVADWNTKRPELHMLGLFSFFPVAVADPLDAALEYGIKRG